MSTPRPRATVLLQRLSDGDLGAADELLPLIYDELHHVADRLMNTERRNHTLQPTALVHEAWLKLIDTEGAAWNDRAHFVSVAARAMRRVLTDHARGRATNKRGGDRARVLLDGLVEAYEQPAVDLLALDQALDGLNDRDPELTRLVELRFFGGLTVKETANVMGVSYRRIERNWTLARSWLQRAIGT